MFHGTNGRLVVSLPGQRLLNDPEASSEAPISLPPILLGMLHRTSDETCQICYCTLDNELNVALRCVALHGRRSNMKPGRPGGLHCCVVH